MKRIYWISGLIILALAAGVSTYFAYRNSPTASQNTTATPTPSASENSGTVTQIKVFLIALNDNGKTGMAVGCGDSAVAVIREISPTKGPLKASIEELLKIRDQYYGQSGLVNSLYQSNLSLESANIVAGKATIKLSGSLVVGGVCDAPRIKAQLEQTALQFSTVTSVEFFINSKNLDDVLSQK